MEIFAQRLKALRLERKRTLREMADYLEVGMRAYQYYEDGSRHPDYQSLVALADYFQVTTDYLLGRTEERT